MDWQNLNRIRFHNKNESMIHFIAKSMVSKILFDEGYCVFTERVIGERVADVFASTSKNKNNIVVEIETKPTKKHNKELQDYYTREILYIIDTSLLPENLELMENKIKHDLGFLSYSARTKCYETAISKSAPIYQKNTTL